MSLFSQEHSHRGSTSEGKATDGWSEELEEFSLCYGRRKLEGRPVLDATVFSSAMSPLAFAGSDDSANSLLLDKLHIYSDFGEDKKEGDEELIEAALLTVEPTTAHCLGTGDSMASPTKELCPNEVFVCNIKYSTTKEQLTWLFSRCGAVASISLPLDKMASRNKGYAFIAFERDESVQRAIVDMNGAYLNGRPLTVRRKTECQSPSTRRSAHTKSATRSAHMFRFADVLSPITAAAAARSHPPAVGETKSLFVGNVPFKANRREIHDLFSEACGNSVESVRLVTTALGKPRGFGYVDFRSKADATKALSLNGHVISGRVLRVNYADGYKPDFCKKRAQRLASTHASDALAPAGFFPSVPVMTDGTLVADAPDCCRVRAPVPVPYYFQVIQVPRGYYYALVPMRAVSGSLMAAMRPDMAQLPLRSHAFLPSAADCTPRVSGRVQVAAAWDVPHSEATAYEPF